MCDDPAMADQLLKAKIDAEVNRQLVGMEEAARAVNRLVADTIWNGLPNKLPNQFTGLAPLTVPFTPQFKVT